MRRLCCMMLAVSLCLALCGCNSYTIVVTDKDFQFPNYELRSFNFMDRYMIVKRLAPCF